MASSQPLPTPSSDLNTELKFLWPDKELELDVVTEDYLTWYADLWELVWDLH